MAPKEPARQVSTHDSRLTKKGRVLADLADLGARAEIADIGPADDEAIKAYAHRVGAQVEVMISGYLSDKRGVRLPSADLVADQMAEWLSGLALPSRSDMGDLVGPFWTAEHARKMLGLTRSGMAERRKSGSILAMEDNGDFFYPVNQFETHQGVVRVRPGLRSFLIGLKAQDSWTVGVLLHTPAPELDDSTPLEWVRQKRDQDVLAAYAHRLTHEWSH